MAHSSTTDRWQRIDLLFCKSLELPADQVCAYLDRKCTGDPSLRGEVEALLAQSARASGLRTQGWASPILARDMAADLARHDALDPGTVVGAYRIRHELGRGGMAVVYSADRIDGGFDQQVALKVIKRGLDSEELLRRFLVERQILASLEHPNIARLLDGGVTGDGRPFFAMEWVDGVPIDEFATARALTVVERLRLFMKVGRAVEAAHRQLVVHRDLKPSNLLVTPDGVPKLLDFGIAKLLAPELDHRTHTSARLLTPEFASPEQMRGEVVTTAADVYQLGVLLYLLLTGQNPHRTEGRTISDIEHAVCHRAPTRPSASLGPDSAWKPKRLRGDLDNIVLRALDKDPEKRYRSVAHLVDDVERHLDHRPVRARAPSFVYRGRKWVGRNKTVVGAVLALAVLTAVYAVRLVAERSRAERAAVQAQQTVTALESLFGDFDPYAARGGQVTVRELLDRATANVGRDLSEQPQVQARLRILLGNLFNKLGAFEPATAVAQQALEQNEALYGPAHPAVARAAITLGIALSEQSRFRDARTVLERAVAVLEHHPEARQEDLAEALGRLSRLAWVFGEHDHAFALSGRALARQEAAVGPDHPSVAGLLYDRAQVFIAVRQPGAAVPLLERATTIWRRAEGEESVRFGRGLFLLGRATGLDGSPKEALRFLQQSLTITKSALGSSHTVTGDVLIELGVLLGDLGRDEESLSRLYEGIAVHREIHGNDSPATLRSASLLGHQLKTMGRYSEARALYSSSLASLEQTLGNESPHLYPALTNLAESTVHSGDLQSGLALHRRALGLLRQDDHADPAELQKTLHAIAELLVGSGQADEARTYQAEADRMNTDSIAAVDPRAGR